MNKFFMMFCLCLFPFIACAEEIPAGLVLEVKSVVSEGRPMVAFALANKASQPVRVPKAYLPWNNRNCLVVVVANRKTGELLPAKHRIDDFFGSGHVEIAAGQTIEGSVALDRYADGALKALKEQEMLVFWYFKAPAEISGALGEHGGWFVFPRLSSNKVSAMATQ